MRNLGDLLKVTQLVNNTAVIETQVCVTQDGLKDLILHKPNNLPKMYPSWNI